MAEMLSVVIITFNEERNIKRCLESIQDIADEIIIVDSYSTDSTKAIAEKFDVKFVEQKWLGYSEQKNFANSLSTYSYVLSIDADEALSKELTAEISQLKSKTFSGVYSFNRLTNFCGTWIHHSSWYPDKKVRIFDRRSIKWEGAIHEKLNLENQKVTHLKGDLLHYSYYTIEDHLKQIEKFSTIAAIELHKNGHRGSKFKANYKALAKFIKIYILFKGYKDREAGLIIAKNSAYAAYQKYYKLKKLNDGQSI